MSVIYSIGDRVLVAAMASRSSRNALTPLYTENNRPTGIRLQECVVSGVTGGGPAGTDAPASDSMLFLSYIGANEALHTLDYASWNIVEPRAAARINRQFEAMGLTEEQRTFLRHYAIPRPVASTGYIHMMTDLTAMFSRALNREDTLPFTTADKEAVLEQARALGIEVHTFPTYRGISAIIQEPDFEAAGTSEPAQLVGFESAVPEVSVAPVETNRGETLRWVRGALNTASPSDMPTYTRAVWDTGTATWVEPNFTGEVGQIQEGRFVSDSESPVQQEESEGPSGTAIWLDEEHTEEPDDEDNP